MQQHPFFSIVIPTLNEEVCLPQLLADLSAQTENNFEVVHVDAFSEDKTLQKAQEFAKKITITSLQTKTRNVSHQRNLGSSKVVGEWVIFMDADNRLPADFLAVLKQNIEQAPQIDIFTTLIETKKYDFSYKLLLGVGNILLTLLSYLKPSGPGSLIGVRRQLAQTYFFDTTARLSEDHLYIETITKKGHRFACFTQPRYIYSLRRIKKNGILKTIQLYIVLYFKFLFKKPLTQQDTQQYPMAGGDLYSRKKK